MRTGKVISLCVGGLKNKIFKTGDTVNEDQFPIGNWDLLVEDGHILEGDDESPEEPKKPLTLDQVSKAILERDLNEAGIGFDVKSKKEVLYDLWLTLQR